MTTKIYITRHGEREDFINRSWYSTAERSVIMFGLLLQSNTQHGSLCSPDDPPLSQRGLRQANCLKDRLVNTNIKHIFCSPYIRCLQTVTPLAEALGIPIKVEHGLGEWFGEREITDNHQLPLPLEKLHEMFPLVDLSYQSFHQIKLGLENEDQLQCRVYNTAKHIVSKYVDGTGDILLVGHAATTITSTRGILALNHPTLPDNFFDTDEGRPFVNAGVCSLVQIELRNPENRWHLTLRGDVSHMINDPIAHGSGRYYNWHFPRDISRRKQVEWYH